MCIRDRFSTEPELVIADIDCERITQERLRNGTFNDAAVFAGNPETRFRRIAFDHAPVLTDGEATIIESGAIIDYVIRRHAGGRLAPDPASPDYDAYQQWLHYAEGSAMLPLMLRLYVGRLGAAGAPLHPRIDSEIGNHLAYVESALKDRLFFVGDDLTGADIQMSFVAEVAKAHGKLADYPHLEAWIGRMHARPAWKAALEKSGAYKLGD